MHLSPLDLAVLGVYFLIIVILAVWVGRRSRDTEDYFVGGRKVPGWAVGLSILGTCISSVTYVAYPGMSFVWDWQYLVQGLMLPLLVFCGALVVVRFYRRQVRTTVNEYLETRFGPGVRLYSLFVLGISELARLSMVMYLLSLVIHTISGISIVSVILVLGTITIIYTVAGGIEGIIWTDVLQTVVLFSGGIIAIVVASAKVPGGFPGLVETAWNADKFRLLDFSPDLTRPTFYVLALSGLLNFFYFLSGNQNQVQRYQCAPSDREAKKAALIGSLGSVPVWALFMLVGTSLYVFYQYQPEPAIEEFLIQDKGDKVFPYFIATRIPEGLAGLLLAGMFAAAMSSIDSSMNALSTMFITDLYRRFINPDVKEKRALFLARLLTLLWGALGVFLALAMIRVGTFLEFYFEVVAVIGGGIAGIFFLALFTKKTHSRGMVAGIIAGLLIMAWGSSLFWEAFFENREWLRFPWDPIMVGVVSSAVVVAVGYFASYVIPPGTRVHKDVPVLWEFWK
jgi:SSS family solute:Na+ symporter